MRSLPNKADELVALTQYMREYHHCSLMMFTESWLIAAILDIVTTLDGFQLIWMDRMAASDKRRGGGLAFVNDSIAKTAYTVCYISF